MEKRVRHILCHVIVCVGYGSIMYGVLYIFDADPFGMFATGAAFNQLLNHTFPWEKGQA
jgi:hypothetical protein